MQLALSPDDMAAATELLRRGGDPRRSFCLAAARLLHADVATLWELQGGELRPTASSRTAPELVPTLPLDAGAAARRASHEGERVFVPDAGLLADADPGMVACVGVRSILAEPVSTGGRRTGAIVIGWRTPVEEIDPLVSAAVGLMAVQASLGIERADLAARLERQTLTDPLTDLLNRRGLARELDREMARATRNSTPLGFALMDIDNFKAYNDAHGHAGGDRLLVRAARAWSAQVRMQDSVARWGGEEFVILLPDCGAGSASPLAVVERVRAATPGGQTASVGLAIWDGGEPAPRLAERADAALYSAKQRGRDRALAA